MTDPTQATPDPERTRLLEEVAEVAYEYVFGRVAVGPLRAAVVALRRHDAKARKNGSKAGTRNGGGT